MANPYPHRAASVAVSPWRMQDHKSFIAATVTAIIVVFAAIYDNGMRAASPEFQISRLLLQAGLFGLDLFAALYWVVSACLQGGLAGFVLLIGSTCYLHEIVSAVVRLTRAKAAARQEAALCEQFRAALEVGDDLMAQRLANELSTCDYVVARLAAAVHEGKLAAKVALEHCRETIAKGSVLFGALEESSPLLVAAISYAKVGYLIQCIATGLPGLVRVAEEDFGQRLVLSCYGIGLAMIASLARTWVEAVLSGHTACLQGLLDAIEQNRQRRVLTSGVADLTQAMKCAIDTAIARAVEISARQFSAVNLTADAFEPRPPSHQPAESSVGLERRGRR